MSPKTASAPVEVIYTAPTGKRTAGRIHRATCRHIPKGAVLVPPADAGVDALLDASRATCCSVREADRNHAVSAARSAEMDASANARTDPQVPAGDAVSAGAAGAAPAAPAAAAASALPQAAARTPRTFDPAGVTDRKCEGACGAARPVRAFPTAGSSGKRGVECRACRDSRRQAARGTAA